jgi:hypothetical protein
MTHSNHSTAQDPFFAPLRTVMFSFADTDHPPVEVLVQDGVEDYRLYELLGDLIGTLIEASHLPPLCPDEVAEVAANRMFERFTGSSSGGSLPRTPNWGGFYAEQCAMALWDYARAVSQGAETIRTANLPPDARGELIPGLASDLASRMPGVLEAASTALAKLKVSRLGHTDAQLACAILNALDLAAWLGASPRIPDLRANICL